MKKLMVIILVVTLLAMGSGVALAGVGNAVPSGPHYNLNLIGMPSDSKGNVGCGQGHRIFVQLSKTVRVTTRILLTEGDFAVIDCDGTDGEAAFQLPNPDPENTGTTVYSVFIRVVGKPGGDITMDTCATDPGTGEEVCSDYKVLELKKNRKFQNVSKELLYIYAWIGGAYKRVPLFSDVLEDYLWRYDNNRVRIAQLRFYPGVSTEVP